MNPFLYDTGESVVRFAQSDTSGAQWAPINRTLPPDTPGAMPLRLRKRRQAASRTVRLARRAVFACVVLAVSLQGGAAHALDVNTASIDALQALRGLGPKTAAIIVQERDRAGPYESLEDLSDRVRGLGEKKVRALQIQGLRADDASRQAASSVLAAESPLARRTPTGRASPVSGAMSNARAVQSRAQNAALVATPVVTTPTPARYDRQHENLSHARTNRR